MQVLMRCKFVFGCIFCVPYSEFSRFKSIYKYMHIFRKTREKILFYVFRIYTMWSVAAWNATNTLLTMSSFQRIHFIGFVSWKTELRMKFSDSERISIILCLLNSHMLREFRFEFLLCNTTGWSGA